MKPFRIAGFIEVKDGAPFFFIGGPCVIESTDHIDFMCGKIREICARSEHSVYFQSFVRQSESFFDSVFSRSRT